MVLENGEDKWPENVSNSELLERIGEKRTFLKKYYMQKIQLDWIYPKNKLSS